MKYFAISDIHGFYEPMMQSLHKAGYRKNNPDHILIVCGDIFDRGPDSVKVYKFLKSIPKDRRILIRGNHEYLLRDIVERNKKTDTEEYDDLQDYDYHNGTVDTLKQFIDYYYPGTFDNLMHPAQTFGHLPILDWIFGDEWVNYYELDNYIFVHSWIPVDTHCNWPLYSIMNYSGFTFDYNWKQASDFEWEEASWGCPWLMYHHKLYPEDKIIVCGHWHTSDFRTALDKQGQSDDNSLYKGDHIIGLDACTVLTGYCNVLVIDK